MNPQDDPEKATQSLKRAQIGKQARQMIRVVEFFYDWLGSGKSVEELEIELDIAAAGGALSESSHKFWRKGLEIMKTARKERADRNEVITRIRETAKALCEIPQAEQLLFGFAERKP